MLSRVVVFSKRNQHSITMKLLKGNQLLSRTQCDVLRGLAITGIFIHNFCHWLRGAHPENEFNFHPGNSTKMWDYWTGAIDQFAPIQFFSFFGHYGVPLFLFLSGYGLVMKYERAGEPRVKALPFLEYQWLKLFRLMILGYILSFIVYVLWCDSGVNPWNVIAAQLSLTVNFFFENPGTAMLPGPYWFFGLMLEIYVIYRLLIYPGHDKRGSVWRWLVPVLLIVVAWAVMAVSEGHDKRLVYLRYNAFVGMLPLCMGVLTARYGLPRLSKWLLAAIAIVALPGLAVANLNFHAWLWAPVLVVAGAVAFVKCVEGAGALFERAIMKPLAWMGMLSAHIFVVLSLPRMPMFKFVLWKQKELLSSDYWWILLYIVLTIVLAWLHKQYLSIVPAPRLRSDSHISFSIPRKKR